MSLAMARRGPDDHGLGSYGAAVLGHRRLAIFDLSEHGRQPMVSFDGELALVFNGAIYNFIDLRKQLRSSGCVITSATDTEVLLHGYQAWGMAEMVKRLRGMFAFALWDRRRGRLFLVRDRLGVKPLVYAVRGRQIAFASTVNALRQGGFAGALNEAAVLDVLRWGFVQEPHAIYSGIIKLAPATILEWHDGAVRQERFWQVPSADDAPPVSFAATVEASERALLDAVAVRLHADVPVGVLLSGGIDSSLVCWALVRLGAALTAYTVAVPGDDGDEAGGAIATAQRLKLRHRVIPIVAEGNELLDELLQAFDEPFASASALGMLRVARAVRAQAKVLLTGDGGDDVFFGYPRHRHLWLSEQLSMRAPALGNAALRWLPRMGPLKRAASFCDYAAGGVPAYLQPTYALTQYRQCNLFGPRLEKASTDMPLTAELDGHGWVERLATFERRGRFVGEYLRKIDGATMYHGLEARAPFLDQQLWEFAATLPVAVRLSGGRLKAPLRAIASRRIGRPIAWRKKRGFTIPVLRWLARQWRDRAHDLFNDSMLARSGWIDRKHLLAELDFAVARGCAAEPLWNVFVLESWLQRDHLETISNDAMERTLQATTATMGARQ
jgi:asparagine synthase (glutamine-hydrolysing)